MARRFIFSLSLLNRSLNSVLLMACCVLAKHTANFSVNSSGVGIMSGVLNAAVSHIKYSVWCVECSRL